MANESTPQGITAITVSGFKSLRDESRIEVRPLTILAGANSSGKSSIMQPLLLMKQTLEAPYDPGPLLLGGPNVKFTSAEQFLSVGRAEEYQEKFTAGLELYGIIHLNITFERIPKKREIKLVELFYSEAGLRELTLRPEMTHEDILVAIARFGGGEDLRIVRNRCFLEVEAPDVMEIVYRGETVDYGRSILLNPGYPFQQALLRLAHIPGLRGNPERTYPATPVVGPMFQATFEKYVAGVIRHWQEKENVKLLTDLGNALAKLGLSSGLGLKQIDDTQLQLRVGRTLRSDGSDTVNIADVGFGVSQVLPVLVALLVAEPGQLVYIEQPELHLHPRAQVALAQVLADAANRGVRVVAETHSDLLLLGLQTLVAEGKLSPDIVKLHWFERDEDGVTHITSSDVEEDGAFENWPEDFSEVTLKAQSRYLDAAEAHHVGS